ncbi:sensor domain-containing diguanylate cyclase [Anaerospora hongkongensis]|uniref:sensor domain-containing diguanylate cyclase n=1 Tax=Anaerospora hongkongensis TaxID=244830 RepID=UPI00289AEF8A|nr:sensor domain-containing diguanylate cyclase [Anaerospora hongkongensis]
MRFLHRITLLLSGLVIISSIIQFVVFDRFFLTTTDSLLLTTNEKAATNVAEQLLGYFHNTADSLKTVAANRRIRQDQELLDEVNRLIPAIDMLMVLDKNGTISLVSGNKNDIAVFNLSDRDYFQRAIKGETYISGVFTSPWGRKVIAIATPIWENGKISGVVVGVCRLHGPSLTSLFDNKTFGRGGFITILDNEGTVVYHTDKERIGKKGVIAELVEGVSGAKIGKNYTGMDQYIGYSKVSELNWTVSVITPTAEIAKTRRIIILEMLAVSIFAILTIIGIGTYTVRRYTKPLAMLLEGFSSIKKGSYKQIPSEGYAAEFDMMIQVYNDTVKRLEEVHTTLEGAAGLDELTKVYNRRSFEKMVNTIETEIHNHMLQHVGIMIMDIDYFKQINDSQGHLGGDEVLRKIAAIIVSVVGARAVFRFGGDEFAVITRNSTDAEVADMAEEIRSRCEKSLNGYTVSIGIAVYPGNTDSVNELLHLADKALYTSKEFRNKVTAYKGKQ